MSQQRQATSEQPEPGGLSTPVGPSTPEIAVDRDAEVPLELQLGWSLSARIRDGTFAPGQRLPGLREMAEASGLNINTVRAVYQRLEQRGLIQSLQGSGTFVATTPAEHAAVAAIVADAAARPTLRGSIHARSPPPCMSPPRPPARGRAHAASPRRRARRGFRATERAARSDRRARARDRRDRSRISRRGADAGDGPPRSRSHPAQRRAGSSRCARDSCAGWQPCRQRSTGARPSRRYGPTPRRSPSNESPHAHTRARTHTWAPKMNTMTATKRCPRRTLRPPSEAGARARPGARRPPEALDVQRQAQLDVQRPFNSRTAPDSPGRARAGADGARARFGQDACDRRVGDPVAARRSTADRAGEDGREHCSVGAFVLERAAQFPGLTSPRSGVSRRETGPWP